MLKKALLATALTMVSGVAATGLSRPSPGATGYL